LLFIIKFVQIIIIKENRSDDVVKYFQSELENARQKLKEAEDKLLEFNEHTIINYYEQSKAVAVVRKIWRCFSDRAELAGIQAATKRLEEKLKYKMLFKKKV
jgi:uncharacterized protein YigA (DUF484 family)